MDRNHNNKGGRLMKKRFTKFMLLLVPLFCAGLPLSQTLDAQTGQTSKMLSSLVINTSATPSGGTDGRVPLKIILNYLQNKYNVQFFYQDDTIRGKYGPSMEALRKQGPGKNFATLLNNLDLSYVKIDANTYVLFPKDHYLDHVVQKTVMFKVSGRATDATTGDPLPGVDINVKGTTIGAATDKNGDYTLNAPSSTDTLMFSYIGYVTQAIPINGNHTINVALASKVIAGHKMVVIGYGKSTERSLIESVSSTQGKSIQNQAYSNVGQALQGRASGLFIKNSGGRPGSTPSISIRGGGTPLFVIDNRITSESEFDNLLPNDIKSVSVLKGASATAVYGARAANGIILVQTKTGTPGKFTINYSESDQFSQPTILLPKNNAYQYALETNQGFLNDGYGKNYVYSSGVLDTIKNHLDPFAYPNNNLYALTLRQFAPQYRHDISLQGGAKHVTYYLSLGYFNQGSIFKTNADWLHRLNYRANVTSYFKNIGLSVGLDLNGYKQDTRYPSRNAFQIWSHIQDTNPLVQLFNKNGTYGVGVDNPVVELDPRSGYNKTNEGLSNTRVNVQWDVPMIKGLELSAWGNYQTNNGLNKFWDVLAPQYTSTGQLFQSTPPSLSMSDNNNTALQLEAELSYSRSVGKNDINLQILRTQNRGFSQSFSASRNGYLSSAVDQLFAGPSSTEQNSGSASENGRVGYVGRVKYNYNDEYLAEFDFRYDGSDHFPVGKRWGFFPSVSAGWVLTKEKFLNFLQKDHILNFLKLRGSYGTVGNDNVAPFAYVQGYNLDNNVYVVGGKLVNGFSPGALVSQDLTWYTQHETDAGFDFYTLNNRLQGSFDYFFFQTTGYLTSPTNRYTTPLGASMPEVKSNSEDRRAGYEFSLDYNGRVGNNITYQIGGNLSHYNHLWVRNANESLVSLNQPRQRTTQETGYWGTGLTSLGLFQNVNQIINSALPLSSNYTQPGDIRYKDVNGDGQINNSDNTRIGVPTSPRTMYGINLNFGYKSWDLNALLQGTGRTTLYMSGNIQTAYYYQFEDNTWTPNNPNARFPRKTSETNLDGNNNYKTSTFWFVNGEYLRLKSLSISYNLKTGVLRNLNFLSKCRVSLNAVNLFTISQAMKYFDPENSSTSGYGYPVQRVFSLNVNLGF